MVNARHYEQAVEKARQSLAIVDPNHNPVIGSWTYVYVAVAQLCLGDVDSAFEAAKKAARFNVPLNDANSHAVLGVIRLRRGDRAGAQADFREAVNAAEQLTLQNQQNINALETRALALSGLVVCEDGAVANAIDAYQVLRTINRDAGHVARALLLLDALCELDEQGRLRDVRNAAAGR